MKKGLEFTTLIYTEKSFKEYAEEVKAAEELAEITSNISDDIAPPVGHVCRVTIDPNDIDYIQEIYSPEEGFNNPESPSFDNTALYMKWNECLIVRELYDSVKQRLAEYK